MTTSAKWLLGIVIIAALAFGLWKGFSAAEKCNGEPCPENTPGNGSISQAAVNDFITKVRATTIAKVGRPIEGFEPFMFMQAYPGLVAKDFDGVDALIGGYEFENGALVYDLKGERELHSAARAISDEGMLTLLVNIAARLEMNLEGEDTVDDVLREIEKKPVVSSPTSPSSPSEPGTSTPSGNTATFRGEIVCLPHKNTSGPQTLECAFGLENSSGTFYGLKNLGLGSGIPTVNTGDTVSITGTLEQPDPNTKYNIQGTINVQSVTRVN